MSTTVARSSRRPTAFLRVAALSLLVVATACGGGTRSVGSQQGMPRGDRYVITAAEIEASKSNNLYDAVAKLRPDFLRQRGNSLAAVGGSGSSRGEGPGEAATSSKGTAVASAQVPVRVYQNDMRLLGTDDLRQIPMSTVVEVRYIPGPQAGVRYGTDHTGGVILVKTR